MSKPQGKKIAIKQKFRFYKVPELHDTRPPPFALTAEGLDWIEVCETGWAMSLYSYPNTCQADSACWQQAPWLHPLGSRTAHKSIVAPHPVRSALLPVPHQFIADRDTYYLDMLPGMDAVLGVMCVVIMDEMCNEND